MHRYLTTAAAGAFALALLSSGAAAFNNSPDPLTPAQVKAQLAKASAAIAGEQYRDAIATLNDIVKADARNADAYNLLGYSYRKTKDFDRAERNYERALRLDPDHKGALEYMGELFLETNRRAKAEALLVRLEKLCPSGCEELDDLRAAMAGKQTSSSVW